MNERNIPSLGTKPWFPPSSKGMRREQSGQGLRAAGGGSASWRGSPYAGVHQVERALWAPPTELSSCG
eukprot:2594468-Prymnesium_polylepis.1